MANNRDFEVYKIGDVVPDFLVSPVGSFSCGNEELDRFLKERACLYCRESLAATFLFLAEIYGARAAAGYVSICNGSVSRKIFHNAHCNNNPVSNRRFQKTVLALIDESKYMQEYPATKIARLAIDESFQRSGLGSSSPMCAESRLKTSAPRVLLQLTQKPRPARISFIVSSALNISWRRTKKRISATGKQCRCILIF